MYVCCSTNYMQWPTSSTSTIKAEPTTRLKADSSGGFLGTGQQPPPHQLADLWSAVSSCTKVSAIFSTQDDLF